MKKLLLLICLLGCGGILLGQNQPPSKKADSIIKAPGAPTSAVKKADGSAMLSSNDIISNIIRSAELSSFYKLILATGLSETFKSQGPITVFAPDNQAFTKLSAGKLDTLLMPEHKYDLIALVTYHALAGVVTTRDIIHAINSNKGVASFITITGNKLTAKLDANRNIVLVDENGGQSVISKFNIEQSNGLIHIINGVLIPRFKNI